MPNVILKIKAGTVRPTLEAVREKFATFSKGLPFDYHFLDDDYAAIYKSENLAGQLAWYFAALAILISCLGLYGLSAFSAQRRQKEIGIRKVLGASTGRVALMLSEDFLVLIGIALLLSFPLAGWLMSSWLADFAYRIHLGWTVYLLAAAVIMVITLFTISSQSLRAAMANPVKSLRNE